VTKARRQRAAAQVEDVKEWWRTFWFSAQPAYTLGLVRIAFGALVVYVTLDLLPGMPVLFSEKGPVPSQPSADDHRWIDAFQFGILQIWTSDTAVLIAWTLLLLSAISLTVGWHSRVSALLVWVLFVSFVRRNPLILYAGDQVMTNTGLILALSSCGAALSLDQRRRTGRFWSAEERARWPVRLMQAQLSLIYLFSAQTKFIGEAWNDGSAVSFPWRMYHDWAILPVPLWLAENSFLVNVATWGTMLIETSLAILVWNRRCRYWVLGAGVVLHTLIWLNMSVMFFSLAMLILYLAWVPWETVRDLPDRVKLAVGRRFNRRFPPPAESLDESQPKSAAT
jgi:vitamin K-dependent gamma-carboxylase-like protein